MTFAKVADVCLQPYSIAWTRLEFVLGWRADDGLIQLEFLLSPSDIRESVRKMLAKRVIPCLDVHAGRVVKGTNFLNLRDAGDPVSVASRYETEGADELVFLDITASHEDRGIILDVVRRTAEQVFCR